MPREGECYDNAQSESFWLCLMAESLEVRERPVFADLAEVQVSVVDYFDYYNRNCTHFDFDDRTHQQFINLVS